MRYAQGSRLGSIFRFFLIEPLSGLNKNPILLRGKSFHLVYFGLFAAVNTFVTASVLLFYIDAKGHDFKSSLFLILGLCMAGDMLGVKLFHVISLGRKFFGDAGKYLNQTAMYNQGGVLGVFFVLFIISLIEDIDLIVIFDAAAYGAVIGLVFGRLGCYNYGCCFGKPAKSVLSVTYTNPDAKVLRLSPELRGIPLVPTQIYSSYANLFMFILFTIIARSFPFDGVIALLFIVLYNGFRILIEKYRIKSSGPDYAMVAVFMLIGFLLFLVWYSFFSSKVFSHSPLQYPISLYSYCKFISNRRVFLPVIVVSVVSFLFYGVHGKTLGKHIEF